MKTWRFISAALMVTALGACGPTDSVEQQVATRVARMHAVDALTDQLSASSDTDAWANADLPSPFSPLTVERGHVIYRAVIDEELYLIAATVHDGQERWRTRIDPLGQLLGIAPAPLVSEEMAVVVAPRYRDRKELLIGLDLFTGEELWASDVDFRGVPAFICGSDVCSHVGTQRSRYDILTGERQTDDAPEVGTRFDVDDQHQLAMGRREGLNPNVIRFVPVTNSGPALWEQTALAIAEHSGVEVDAGRGWSGRISRTDGIAALFLGSPSEASGVWTGLDLLTGEIRWTYVDTQACIFDDYSPDDILVCTQDDEHQYISRLDYRTGEPMWIQPIASADDWSWVSAVPGIVIAADSDEELRIDIESGELLERTPVSVCGYSGSWERIFVEHYGEDQGEFRAATHAALCDSNFNAVAADEAREADPDLATAAFVDGGNGWLIGVDVDGTLMGAMAQ